MKAVPMKLPMRAPTVEHLAANRRLLVANRSKRKSQVDNRALLVESQIMQAKLRLLTRQILTAQEEERKKISRELHDEVVQTLVGINVELSALSKSSGSSARQLQDKIARTQRLVRHSVDTVHRFARELRPSVLDDLGLIPALHTYCKSLAERHKIKIKLTVFGGVEAMDEIGLTVLFRVAQEALTNVARHAKARVVRLTISQRPEAIRMEISDDGKAFEVGKVLRSRSQKRLGLVGMKERVEMIGGTLSIESVRNQGTTVQAEIPFVPERTTS
jgi:signal transduction histidine kinase